MPDQPPPIEGRVDVQWRWYGTGWRGLCCLANQTAAESFRDYADQADKKLGRVESRTWRFTPCEHVGGRR